VPVASFDVMIAPESLEKYKKIFELNNMKYNVIVNNIQK
jgi:hypothetical protein